MKTVRVTARMLGIVTDSSIDIGMADRVPDVMAEVSAEICQSLLALLTGRNLCEVL